MMMSNEWMNEWMNNELMVITMTVSKLYSTKNIIRARDTAQEYHQM